jgi:GT2 family glycosyltransferase
MLARDPHDARIEVSNEPAGSVKGEFIVFLDPQGRLARDALYEVVKRLNRNPLTDLFYWDEDRIDSQGRRSEPFFKPDWNPDLLLSMNYIGECFLLRRALAEELEGPRREFAPAQNYDLALRATERTSRIVHIPEVLYHRHLETASPSAPHDSARTEPSARALEAALKRRDQHGVVATIAPGLYAVRYEIRDDPLVSILIPTRDRCEMLRQCLDSIYRATDYRKYEIIILDNDSKEPATLAYFEELAGKVQVVRCPGPFNFSALNNLGAAMASGEYLLFLNNDTEVIRRDWMRAMLEQAQRPEVGAVGAKLLFADERIQHAGVVLGMGGLAGHAFEYEAGHQLLYFGLSDAIRDCSAVTAACMMMRRAVFDEVGRFDEALVVEFNDIDLCLRLRERGYLVVYTPLALLHHFESVTRRHFPHLNDHQLFVKRWEHCLRNGDPYYNRNLTLAGWDFSIGT